MAFEQKLRRGIKSLPVGELTEPKRQEVLRRVQIKTKRSHLNRMLPPLMGAVAICGVLVVVGGGAILYQHTVSQRTASTLTLENSVLNTDAFRNAVYAHFNSPSSSEVNTTANDDTKSSHTPSTVKNLTVRWSQTDDEFGFAFVSYRIGQDDYFAGVVAKRVSNAGWRILQFNALPNMSQIDAAHLPIYNYEQSMGGATGVAIGKYPGFFMVCGIVINQSVTRVRITWHDGHQTDVPVENGVYGYVETFPSTENPVYGPKKIEAFNDSGQLMYSQ